jgi:hypothetical protein
VSGRGQGAGTGEEHPLAGVGPIVRVVLVGIAAYLLTTGWPFEPILRALCGWRQ